MSGRAIQALVCISFSIVVASPAHAATCNVSTTGISLGLYVPNQPLAADSTGAVNISCNKSALDALPLVVNYSVDISTGSGSSYALRAMTSGVHTLRYNLYREVSRISIWGDTTGGTSNVTGSLLLSQRLGSSSSTHSIYGRIFPDQNVMPGTYVDALLITVTY